MNQKTHTLDATATGGTARPTTLSGVVHVLPIGLIAGVWWALSLAPLDAATWLVLRLMLGAILLAAGLILSVGLLDRLFPPRRTEVTRRAILQHH